MIRVDIFATREKYMKQAFVGVGKFLWGTFLPRLFFEKMYTLPPILGTLSKFLIKIPSGPTEPCDIISRKIYKFAPCKLQFDW